jgi:hypothetical protein
MSLERGRLGKLVEAKDLDGICRWVDDVVAFAKSNALDEHFAEVARVCGPPPESLRDRIKQSINAVSAENGSDTPDFILADYLIDCLAAFDKTVNARSEWYGRKDRRIGD